MTPPQIQQTLQQALSLHQAGQLADAERLYRQVLSAAPSNADALRYLGLLAHQAGQHGIAIELLRKSIASNPKIANTHNTLGEALRVSGKFAEAIAAYQQALRLQPGYPEAQNNLGSALQQSGDKTAARDAFRAAIRLRPNYFNAHLNLASSLLEDSDANAALAELTTAIQIQPNHPIAHALLGDARSRLGRMDDAINAYRRALQLNPNDPDIFESLGRALRAGDNFRDAALAYDAAIKLDPTRASLYSNLGEVYRAGRQLGAARQALERALQLDPNLSEAHSNLATVLASSGYHESALDHLHMAIRLKPDNIAGHSSLLLELNYASAADPQQIFKEHVRWGERHADPLRPVSTPAFSPRDPGKIRIGYVSPDLRLHPVAFFLEPLLRHHDRSKFTIFCYSDTRQKDPVNARLRGLADEWRDIIGMSDEQAAQLIRDEGIDILVDLAGHTAGNRLLVFARKPAPIQMTYLGYPNTTGIAAIDYRITDAIVDPPGAADELHVERLIRLPHCFLCYRPFDDAPSVNPLSAREAGFITFGSFNKLPKVTPATLDLWRQILQRVPNSRLVVKSSLGADADALAASREVLLRNHLPIDRVQVLGLELGFREHLEHYHQIDIALDPFPYNGTTTTCEALWMGVPVITLAGNTHVSRVGASILTNANLPELIASDPEAYVQVATNLAHDLARLTAYRTTLRAHLQQSPLLDAPAFTRDFEDALLTLQRR